MGKIIMETDNTPEYRKGKLLKYSELEPNMKVIFDFEKNLYKGVISELHSNEDKIVFGCLIKLEEESPELEDVEVNITVEDESTIWEMVVNETNNKKPEQKEIIEEPQIKAAKILPNIFQGRTDSQSEVSNFPDWDIVPPNQIINPRIKK